MLNFLEIIFITIIALFFFRLTICRQWESPAGVNMIFNAGMIIAFVITFRDSVTWDGMGIVWILVSCLVFGIGQTFGEHILQKDIESYYGEDEADLGCCEKKIIGNFYYLFCAFCVLLGLLNVVLLIVSNGYSVFQIIRNLDALLDLNTEIAYNRYYGSTAVTVLQQFLTTVSYFGALYGGYLFPFAQNKKQKCIAVMALLPLVLRGLVENTKAGIIGVVIMWGTSYLFAKKTINPKEPFFKLKTIIRLGVLSVLLMGLFLLIMMLRIGSIDGNTWSIVTEKILVYAFGQVYAFDSWFESLGSHAYGLGQNTFMVIFNWLGVTVREQGVYTDFVSVGSLTTNVYTRYRGEILDFGIAGALLFEFIFGAFAGYAWRRLLSGSKKKCSSAKVILSVAYFTCLYGMFVSPWSYSTYTLAFFAYAIALTFIERVEFVTRSDIKLTYYNPKG